MISYKFGCLYIYADNNVTTFVRTGNCCSNNEKLFVCISKSGKLSVRLLQKHVCVCVSLIRLNFVWYHIMACFIDSLQKLSVPDALLRNVYVLQSAQNVQNVQHIIQHFLILK
jgi:hypothetical protein